MAEKESEEFKFTNDLSLEKIREIQTKFAAERGWGQFNTPRNHVLGLATEVGRLAEIFQWKGEVGKGLPDWSQEERDKVGDEITDTLLYLVRLSQACHIDMPVAILRKIESNKEKFPITDNKQ